MGSAVGGVVLFTVSLIVVDRLKEVLGATLQFHNDYQTRSAKVKQCYLNLAHPDYSNNSQQPTCEFQVRSLYFVVCMKAYPNPL